MKDLLSAFKDYLKNLFRNKRITATHVFVLMVSDEHRKIKPYALPAKLVPCRTLRDQFVRNPTREMKCAMERHLLTVGMLPLSFPLIFC